jgi:hypothetical protein
MPSEDHLAEEELQLTSDVPGAHRAVRVLCGDGCAVVE